MAKDSFVYLGGAIEVDGARYLPGEPFEMDVEIARHNLKQGIKLRPAGSVTDAHVAAVRANTTVLDRERDATSILTATPVEQAGLAPTDAESGDGATTSGSSTEAKSSSKK